MKIVAHPALRAFVEENLTEGRSPESVAGRIRTHEKHLPPISADSIERFIRSVYGRKIEAYRDRMRAKRKWKRKRPKVTQLANRKFIDLRPKIIERRARVGDAEADFVVSGKTGKGMILALIDRKLRAVFLELVLPVSVANVHCAFLHIKAHYPELKTISTDNDILFEKHEELERMLGVPIYFCHPYHSWEKGSIENANREIRKTIPKGSDISQYSKKCIARIEEQINDRYMACLNYRTPHEALQRYRKQKQRREALEKKKR